MSRVRRKRHRQPAAAAEPSAPPVPAARFDPAGHWNVVRRHARLLPSSGKPMRCTPSAAELAGEAPRRNSPGNDGKIIYDTREIAEAAITELTALGVGPQRSYHCPRQTTTGHWHITTDGHEARRAKDRLRRQVAS